MALVGGGGGEVGCLVRGDMAWSGGMPHNTCPSEADREGGPPTPQRQDLEADHSQKRT